MKKVYPIAGGSKEIMKEEKDLLRTEISSADIQIVKNRKKQLITFYIFPIILIVLFLSQILFTSKIILNNDVNLMYMRDFTIKDSLKDFEIPLWEYHFQMGSPAVFYPNYLFLFHFLHIGANPFAGMKLFYLISIILAFLFMKFYLKEIGLSETTSSLFGLAYSFNSYLMVHLFAGHLGIVAGITFFIPILIFIERSFKYDSKWDGVGIVVSTFFFFAGSHAQYVYYGVFFILFYVIFKYFQTNNRKRLIKVILIFVISGLISAITVLPSLYIAFLDHSRGTGFSMDRALRRSYDLRQYISLILPSFFGYPENPFYWGRPTFTELTSYSGIVPLFFSIIFISSGWFKKQKPYIIFYLVIIIGSLLLASNSIANVLMFKYFPLYKIIRNPGRILYFFIMGITVIGAHGFQNIFYKEKAKINFEIIFFIISGLTVLYFILQPVTFNLLGKFLEEINVKWHNINFNIFRSLIFSILILLILIFRKKIRVLFLIPFLLMIIFFDQFALALPMKKGLVFKEPLNKYRKILDTIKKDGNIIIYLDPKSDFEVPGYLMYTIAESRMNPLIHYAEITLLNYGSFLNRIDGFEPSRYRKTRNYIENYSHIYVKLASVQYFLTTIKNNSKDLELFDLKDGLYIYKNKKVKGLYPFLPGKKEMLPDNSPELFFKPDRIQETEFFINNPHLFNKFEKTVIGNLNIKNNSQSFDIKVFREGYLIINQTLTPFHIIRINGKKTKFTAIDYIFGAVYLEPGNYDVEIRYSPHVNKISWALFFLGLAFFGFYIFKKRHLK